MNSFDCETKSSEMMMRTSSIHRDHVFICRESLITQYLQDKNFRSAYIITFCFLSILLCCNFVNYAINPSIFHRDFGTLAYFFAGFDKAIIAWILLHFILCGIVLPITKFFVRSGFRLQPCYIVSMILCFVAMLVLPLVAIYLFDLRLLSSGIMLMEQVRLFMKLYSFVVENYRKRRLYPNEGSNANEAKTQTDGEVVKEPTLKTLLYFLFSPTLIYRDEYPRVKRNCRRSFGYAVCMGIHVHGVAMILKFLAAKLDRVGLEPLGKTQLVDAFFVSSACSFMIQTWMNHGMWHQWANLWADALGFGDRYFYGPWWSEKDLGKKIRYVNVVVADFLYEYIYRIIRLWGGSPGLASLLVVVCSGIFHEYILWISFRFFFPIITLSMALSIIFTQMGDFLFKGSRSTTLVMHNMFFVTFNSFLALGYIIEYYLHQNCPKSFETWTDAIVPRMFDCLKIE